MVIRAPLGIGLYGGISILLFSLVQEKSFTILFVESIVLAFMTGILLYINISQSEKFEKRVLKTNDHSHCPYFWTITFVIGTGMGVLTCWILHALDSWNMWLGLTIFSGVYAFAHVSSHDYNLIRHLLRNAEVKDRETYVEWLKLEHSCARSTFQVTTSVIAMVVIGGIVGYFLYQGSFWSPGMRDTVILTTWLIVGVWFGILGPLLGKMYYARDKMRRLARESEKD